MRHQSGETLEYMKIGASFPLKNGGKRGQVNNVERYVGGFCIGKQMEKMPIPKTIEARSRFPDDTLMEETASGVVPLELID
jgi:hypothetical protein